MALIKEFEALSKVGLTDEEIRAIGEKAQVDSEGQLNFSAYTCGLIDGSKAQLKKVVDYLDTLEFYDDWGGESGKMLRDSLKQALLEEAKKGSR